MQLVKTFTIAFALLTIFCGVSSAQIEERRPLPTGLALEIHFYEGAAPAFMSVPAEGGKRGGAWYARFETVPGWQLSEGELPVRAVNIIPRLEVDVVAVNVSVFQGLKFHDRETAVGTYRLRENETVSVTGLKRFGVEPFRIGVVRITPAVPAPPLVKSLANSLEVVSIEPVISTLPTYNLTLHNLSDKDISAFSIDVFVAGMVSMSAMPHGKEGLPLIKAGGFYQSNEPIVVRARPAAAGYTPESPLQETIISAVVFTDGSYEGDAQRAAYSRALTLGRRLALTRLVPLFDAATDTALKDQTQSAQVAAFRKGIRTRSEVTDDKTLAQLRIDFPTLDTYKQDDVKRSLEAAVHLLGVDLLKELDAFEAEPSGDFHAWLLMVGERYRNWLARLH